MMATFENALLTQLKAHQPPDRELGRRRALMSVAAVSLAAAVTVPFVVGRGAPAAYAVDRAGDGTVTFTMAELRDFDGATAALRAAGVDAVVLPVRTPQECDSQNEGTRAPDALVDWRGLGADSVRIHPSAMPADTVLGFTALEVRGQTVVKVLLYDAPGPDCIAIPDKVQ